MEDTKIQLDRLAYLKRRMDKKIEIIETSVTIIEIARIDFR